MPTEITITPIWKAKLEAIKSEYLFDDSEAANAFEFVAKVIELEIDRLEIEESRGVVTIERYRQMERDINDYEYFTESLREDS